MRHVVIDRTTGAVIKNEPMPSDIDPAEYLRQQIHDCPECRAAWERGERPLFTGPDELEHARASHRAREEDLRRHRVFGRRPRWRDLKRRR